jgi:hypothetical protein
MLPPGPESPEEDDASGLPPSSPPELELDDVELAELVEDEVLPLEVEPEGLAPLPPLSVMSLEFAPAHAATTTTSMIELTTRFKRRQPPGAHDFRTKSNGRRRPITSQLEIGSRFQRVSPHERRSRAARKRGKNAFVHLC